MSYDLAVWEGDHPVDDKAAGQKYGELFARRVESGTDQPPATPSIEKYVAALLERWPDISAADYPAEDPSPWSRGPLIGEATGPFLHLPMRYSMAEEASVFAARIASSMGLVCYDPQSEALR